MSFRVETPVGSNIGNLTRWKIESAFCTEKWCKMLLTELSVVFDDISAESIFLAGTGYSPHFLHFHLWEIIETIILS